MSDSQPNLDDQDGPVSSRPSNGETLRPSGIFPAPPRAEDDAHRPPKSSRAADRSIHQTWGGYVSPAPPLLVRVLRQAIERLMALDGSEGGVIIDEDNDFLTMSRDAGGGFDVLALARAYATTLREQAHALNSAGAVEELQSLVVTSPSQYHLAYAYPPGSSRILFAVIDRRAGQLGASRLEMEAIVREGLPAV